VPFWRDDRVIWSSRYVRPLGRLYAARVRAPAHWHMQR